MRRSPFLAGVPMTSLNAPGSRTGLSVTDAVSNGIDIGIFRTSSLAAM
jgi:hypothetical protein